MEMAGLVGGGRAVPGAPWKRMVEGGWRELTASLAANIQLGFQPWFVVNNVETCGTRELRVFSSSIPSNF